MRKKIRKEKSKLSHKKKRKSLLYEFSSGNQVDGSPLALHPARRVMNRRAVISPCSKSDAKAVLKRKRAFSADQGPATSKSQLDENQYCIRP